LRFLTSKHPISISIALLGPLQIPHHNTLHPLPILLSPFLRSRKPSKTPCSPQQVSASRTSGSIPYALSKKTSPRIPAHGRVRCLRGLGVTGTITRKLSVGSNNTAKLPKGCRHLELCTSVKIRCSGSVNARSQMKCGRRVGRIAALELGCISFQSTLVSGKRRSRIFLRRTCVCRHSGIVARSGAD
jgi:hypothetical protein